MNRQAHFYSWLASHFGRFVALRRAAGARYDSQVLLLEAFDRYLLDRVPKPPIHRQQLLDYVESLARLCDRARDNAVCVVWQALAYAILHGAPVEPLPPRPHPAPPRLRVHPPRLVTGEEMVAILQASRALPSSDGLRPVTTATLIGLLWTTGIRIGEALGLDAGDLDPVRNLLSIRHGKFGKSRTLPLRESATEALVSYLRHPKRPAGCPVQSSPLFLSGRRRRLSYPAAATSFHASVLAAGIGPRRAPRFHDLRHSFAVHRVANWYVGGRDVHKLLPALSTYLGHVSVEHTRCYLQANGMLLEHASRLFEARSAALDGGPL
jgi:integrase/recombinase XerD